MLKLSIPNKAFSSAVICRRLLNPRRKETVHPAEVGEVTGKRAQHPVAGDHLFGCSKYRGPQRMHAQPTGFAEDRGDDVPAFGRLQGAGCEHHPAAGAATISM